MGCREHVLASINVPTNAGPAGVVAFPALLLVPPVVRRATAAIVAQPD
jgi:hypothetical protein